MNETDRAALNQIREGLRADSFREAEKWSARLMSLTPEERTVFINEEIARSERGPADPVELAKPSRTSSELAAKLDELYATIQHLPFSDRMEILRGLADTVDETHQVPVANSIYQPGIDDHEGNGGPPPTGS